MPRGGTGRLVAAGAEAEASIRISHVIGNPEQTTQYLITARYIESLRAHDRTQNAKVIFMPRETSTMLSSSARSKECLARQREKRAAANRRGRHVN